MLASPPPAPALIAPLDVVVSAQVQPGSSLHGSWTATSTDGGMWDGQNIKMDEVWQRGARKPLRVRGKASGGPQRVHYLEVAYLKMRTGSGVLTEASPTPVPNPLQLFCHAQGGSEPGQRVGTSDIVSMQIVDQPARGRVVLRGPGIPFLGPECTPGQPEPGEGQDIAPRAPLRRVGILPIDPKTPWRPPGAQTAWQMTIPRAEFAAGGTFRFRGFYSTADVLQRSSNNDVFGSGIMHGKVAIDVRVVRRGRR